jgi:hypothetical protein
MVIAAGLSIVSAQDVTPLNYGEPLTFDVNAAQRTSSFTFEGATGDVVYLTLTPLVSQLDTEMRLFSPGGALLGEGENVLYGAMVGPVELTSDGRYTVSAGRPDWSEIDGEMSLLVDTLTISPMEMGDSQILDFGAPGEVQAFTMNAEAETIIRVQLWCGNCGYGIIAPSGEPFILDGIYGDPGEALAKLPESGEYQIFVESLEVQDDLELYIDEPEIFPLTSNEPMSSVISTFEPAYFSFESQVDKVWQVNAELPQDGGREMEIYYLEGRDVWDTEVANDYGSGPNSNPRIAPFVTPETGTYYVIVYFDDYNEQDTQYDMSVTLSPSSLLRLTPGTQFTGMVSPDTGNQIYLYEGTAGEKLSLTLERTSKDGGLGIRVLSTEDEVAVFNGRDAERIQIDITLPLNGRYQFTVSNIAYDDSAMEYAIQLDSAN